MKKKINQKENLQNVFTAKKNTEMVKMINLNDLLGSENYELCKQEMCNHKKLYSRIKGGKI